MFIGKEKSAVTLHTIYLYMDLDEIIVHPQKALLYMERFVNDGSPSGFTWLNLTSKRTNLLSKADFFYLDKLYTELPIQVIGKLPDFFRQFGENSILIHPDMSEKYNKKGYRIQKNCIRVCPTSSSRTVKLLEYPGYIKLNYNGIIGRIDRSLTETHACFSVEMTEFLVQLLKNPVFSKLALFPEIGAVIYKNENKKTNFGLVYRAEKVYGTNADKIAFIIPAFSCFSRDKKSENEYLLIQLIDKSKKNPEEYILKDLLFLIIDNYFNLLIHGGIQPEWHAQNLLFGIDRNYSITSLIMRDLESIDIDQTLQNSLGIQKKFKSYPYKYLNADQYNYQIKHSFMYDFKIGEYLFKPILKCVCHHYGLNEEKIETKIKEYTNQYIEKLPRDFFPTNNKWYSFANVLIDRTESSRPYVENNNVKYRISSYGNEIKG